MDDEGHDSVQASLGVLLQVYALHPEGQEGVREGQRGKPHWTFR